VFVDLFLRKTKVVRFTLLVRWRLPFFVYVFLVHFSSGFVTLFISLLMLIRLWLIGFCWLRFSGGLHLTFVVVPKWVWTTIFCGRSNVPSRASGTFVSRFAWLEKDRWTTSFNGVLFCGGRHFGFVWLWGLFWLWLLWRLMMFVNVEGFDLLTRWWILSKMNFVGKIVVYQFCSRTRCDCWKWFRFCLFALGFSNCTGVGVWCAGFCLVFRADAGRSCVGIWKLVLFWLVSDEVWMWWKVVVGVDMVVAQWILVMGFVCLLFENYIDVLPCRCGQILVVF